MFTSPSFGPQKQVLIVKAPILTTFNSESNQLDSLTSSVYRHGPGCLDALSRNHRGLESLNGFPYHDPCIATLRTLTVWRQLKP